MTEHAAASSRTKTGTASAAGIVEDADRKARVIPESRRADGSVRKERRVKPGFVPAEDLARFVPSRVRLAQQVDRRGASVPGAAPTTPIASPSTAQRARPPARAARDAVTASSPSSPAKAQPSVRSAPPPKPAWEGPRARARREADQNADKTPDAWDEGEDKSKATVTQKTPAKSAHATPDEALDAVTASLDTLRIKSKSSER